MRMNSEDMPVITWDNKEMHLDDATIGLKGSPTRVNRIFSPERVKGEIIGDGLKNPEEAAALLANKLVERDIIHL
jgi:electron transfer flavoprotein beta subunit